jgi:L-threonylcarbamoyladenylate synthase
MPRSQITVPCVPDNEANRQKAAALLRQGGVVAYPTDTLYGLGASVASTTAIESVFAIKGRRANQPLPVLVASVAQLDQVVSKVSAEALEMTKRFWPGALTLVLRSQLWLPTTLTGGGLTIAVRQPNHATPLALIASCGSPITGTSANRSGGAQPETAEQVVEQLGDAADLVLDGGICPGGVASTIVDMTEIPARVLRQGSLSLDALRSVCSVEPPKQIVGNQW